MIFKEKLFFIFLFQNKLLPLQNQYIKNIMKYFIRINNENIGPLELEDFKNYKIEFSTDVWREGDNEWKKAGDFDELKDFYAQILVPPPFPNDENQKNEEEIKVEEIKVESNKNNRVNKLLIWNFIIISLCASIFLITLKNPLEFSKNFFVINIFGHNDIFHDEKINILNELHEFVDDLTVFGNNQQYFYLFVLIPLIFAVLSFVFLQIRKDRHARIFSIISMAFCFPFPAAFLGLLGTMKVLKINNIKDIFKENISS